MAPTLRGARRRAEYRIAIERMRMAARTAGVRLDLRVHPHAQLSARLIPHFWGVPGETITLEIGPRCRIEEGVTLRIKTGASVILGEDVTVRTGAVLNVSGTLRLLGHNIVSWGSVIHAAEEVTVGAFSGMSEGVTIVDSTHYRTGPGDDGYLNAVADPVVIGERTWLATKSVVLAGCRIGDEVTLAALSIAARSIPSGALAAGQPARVIRERYDGPSPAQRAGKVPVQPDSI